MLTEKTPAGVAAMALAANSLPLTVLPDIDSTLEQCLRMVASQTAFTLSSCRTADMPIVYASPQFCTMTGYSLKEVLGRNCRFLQGAGTSRRSVLEIRNSIQEDRGCTVCILNYTKARKPFWNQLCLSTISDQHGIAYYLGIQTNVTGAVLAYRSQQFLPFQNAIPGPHGGVHSFDGCADIVSSEVKVAEELGSQIKRWHSQKLMCLPSRESDFRPVSCALLPASLLGPLYKLQQAFCLADPHLPDMPIVHASEGFLRLTGRPRDQVIGHNCRFMQSPDTDRAELSRLRIAIREERPITVCLLNCKHDGTSFWNHLHVSPIRNADGKLDITMRNPSQKTAQPSEHTSTLEGEPGKIKAALHGVTEGAPSLASRKSLQITAVSKSLPGIDQELVALSLSARSGSSVEGASTPQDELHPREDVGPREKLLQRSVVGTLRVVCRSLSAKSGLRRRCQDQHGPIPKTSPLVPVRRDISETVETDIQETGNRLHTPTLKSSPI